jgi:phage recombination protein Bet
MSDTAVQVRPSAEIITANKVDEYLVAFGLANQLSEQERHQFVEIATAYQLNPFKREVYCVPYGTGDKRKLSIITGYETYLKRAERVGLLKGWKAWTEGSFTVKVEKKEMQGRNGPYVKNVRLPVGDLVAKIEINRADWDKPFEHEVYLDEYAQDNEMWANKPRTMLKKVCIAQAFRMCFPDEMGGMPYTSDELPPERGIEAEVTIKPAEKAPEPQEAEESQEDPNAMLHAIIKGKIKEFSEIMLSPIFTDEDRQKAKKKIGMGQETSKDYLSYVEGVIDEYKKKLDSKPAEPKNKLAPTHTALIKDEEPSQADLEEIF